MMSSNHNTTDYRNPFAERLSDLMKNKGITQDMLSKYCYVTRQSVGKWVTGQSTPDIDNLAKIADYFDVSTDYLVGRNDYKTTNKATKELCATLGLSEDAINILSNDPNSKVEEYWKYRFTVVEDGIDKTNFESAKMIDRHINRIRLVLNRLVEEEIITLENALKRPNGKRELSLIDYLEEFYDRTDSVEYYAGLDATKIDSSLWFGCSKKEAIPISVSIRDLMINDAINNIIARLKTLSNSECYGEGNQG